MNLTGQQQEQIAQMYLDYINIIKPLLAEIEANYEKFPQPLFNEIRAYNDHVARCYAATNEGNPEGASKQLEKAQNHITRAILDCYKFLNVFYSDEINKFEKETRNIDLKEIRDGDFYSQYKKLKDEAIDLIRQAKIQERNMIEIRDYTLYENAYNKYTDVYNLIEKYRNDVARLKTKKTLGRVGTAILSLVTFILGCILTNNNMFFIQLFNCILQRICGC